MLNADGATNCAQAEEVRLAAETEVCAGVTEAAAGDVDAANFCGETVGLVGPSL